MKNTWSTEQLKTSDESLKEENIEAFCAVSTCDHKTKIKSNPYAISSGHRKPIWDGNTSCKRSLTPHNSPSSTLSSVSGASDIWVTVSAWAPLQSQHEELTQNTQAKSQRCERMCVGLRTRARVCVCVLEKPETGRTSICKQEAAALMTHSSHLVGAVCAGGSRQHEQKHVRFWLQHLTTETRALSQSLHKSKLQILLILSDRDRTGQKEQLSG